MRSYIYFGVDIIAKNFSPLSLVIEVFSSDYVFPCNILLALHFLVWLQVSMPSLQELSSVSVRMHNH
jgi:hypothetical protein